MHGQRVFTDGKQYIVQYVDSHIGGTWKIAGSASGLATRVPERPLPTRC
ncbi:MULTISPECIES: toxin C-terminal domain-containing protein [Amycolatopsis]